MVICSLSDINRPHMLINLFLTSAVWLGEWRKGMYFFNRSARTFGRSLVSTRKMVSNFGYISHFYLSFEWRILLLVFVKNSIQLFDILFEIRKREVLLFHVKMIDKTPLLVRHCLGICPQTYYLRPEETHFKIVIYHIQKRVPLCLC